ncbi:MAG: hypothetical protein MUF05_02645 [Candidatus Omnitrophica bacterium]|jgi:hypothetical protein|nr:hypothetical protein [Candidatus Omnitrophota bacterium]
MRDLVFKNLTCEEKNRRIICASEIVDKEGIRSVIRRHFICTVREVRPEKIEKPQPYLYVLKEHNDQKQQERFFCRLKGSIYAINNGKTYLICFMHSLRITFSSIPSNLMQYKDE